MSKVIAFNSADTLPQHTGIYVVNRGGKLGTPYRWFNADTGQWGRCEYILEDCINSKDAKSVLPALPWCGPVKIQKTEPVQPMELANTPTPKPMVVKAAKVTTAKVTKKVIAKDSVKVKYPDGTIVYREDRQKYMAWFGGKSEAARPTIDAAKSFLTKKYNVTEFNIIDKE